MDVYECVSTLSSVRSFIDKPVPEDDVMKVMESGRLAPSAHNDQPWEFILIKDKKVLEQMEEYCISGRFISRAGFAVVILTDKSSKWFQIDTTRAAQNMALTAWSLDLGTCWIGRLDTDGITSLLDIPDRWQVLTVLPFGYFNKSYVGITKFRKSPQEVFHLDGYGKKF
ncbi:MAG: hypothetical protein GWO07_14500 [Candidatus Dadabacteria bacterium]|nr:hypothetical protein [Candidatus Dadabacteria bacterium]NIV41794.1 hypothetical protein [Candidatus Dadabacteria bacterium]NIX16342.1 hypothetical protein [Candidatus Dadabacteria bacterium]